ncbi:GNAT family N-acetyltransferase [Paenibacillus tarimensis]
MIQVLVAPISSSPLVVAFFEIYLFPDNDALYSPEFLCTDGVKAAIRRREVLIAIADNRIIGAIRFYRKKKQNIVSLYQFAIAEGYRGQGLLKQMLKAINEISIEVLCPISSSFNNYYHKTGWKLLQNSEKFNRWNLQLGSN